MPECDRLKFSEILAELSVELAFNHLANSFGDEFTEQQEGSKEIEEIFTKVLTDGSGIWPGMIDSLKKTLANDQKEKGKLPDTLPQLFTEWRNNGRTRRNIVIIGAGASFDSYKCIPLGNQVIDFLVRKYVDGSGGLSGLGFLREKYEREKKNIEELSGGLFDFENFLYMLQTFFVNGDTLRKDIDELIGFRNSPCLFYEIIAHLLKHQFIDVVINFNFEEMLDQAIEQEIGKDNFHFVLSDGHSVNVDDLIVDGRIKRPVYIKPHGTYSHKSSLRFTKQHYLDMPEDIVEMLTHILGGVRYKEGKKDEAGSKVDRVNIICVGFDMASIEFNRILNKNLPKSSCIYHFLGPSPYPSDERDKSEALVEKLKERLGGFLNELGSGRKFEKDVYRPIWINDGNLEKLDKDAKNQVTSPLAEIFSTLWRMTHGIFKEEYSPRSIARHELISYLFYDAEKYLGLKGSEIPQDLKSLAEAKGKKGQEARDKIEKIEADYRHEQGGVVRESLRKDETSSEYFLDRLLVEIAISLIRNNGVIDIAHALKGRVGKLFVAYQRACIREKKEPSTIYDFFASFWESDKDTQSNVYRRFIFYLNSEPFWRRVAGEGLNALEKGIEDLIGSVIGQFAGEDKREELRKSLIENCLGCHENPFPVLVVLLLLGNKRLSENFRKRFIFVYDKKVYNGLVGEKGPRTVLEELLRICSKSNSSNFFHIGNDLNGIKQKIWESFRPKDLISTNLTLLYHYKTSYHEDSEWNCLLTLVEGGEVIREIFDSYRNNKVTPEAIGDKYKNRKIFLLMSDEAVQSYHRAHPPRFREDKFKTVAAEQDKFPAGDNGNTKGIIYDRLIERHREYLFGDDYKDEVKASFHIFLMPVQEHNNHTTMYLNTNTEGKAGSSIRIKNEAGGDVIISVTDAYHLYRKGYSNSINPIRLNLVDDKGEKTLSREEQKVQRERRELDIEKHLSFFFMNLCRAVSYEKRLGSTNHDKMLDGKLKEMRLEDWVVWDPQAFEKKKHELVGILHRALPQKKTPQKPGLGDS